MTARRLGAHALVLGCFVLVSAGWTFPAVLLDPGRLPGRHFDLLPALRLADHAPTVGLDLLHDGHLAVDDQLHGEVAAARDARRSVAADQAQELGTRPFVLAKQPE